MNTGQKVKIIAAGPFEKKTGKVEAIAEDAPKSIGIKLHGGSKLTAGALVWCTPEEVEEL